ncbi:protein DpdJ [Burkholderia gladioli]|uniref:protein DpdJ n=1 Tax=Burkholderia gladioli TaxID=28095 RepID=UPI001642049E|nr:protein DpdJ [Burkholderia gladioli]MBU9187917.1 DEAD/DEAH box helicase [Burkholderia gladioli]MBU9682865.1 DEAD/DEAH box helicase [Burkholderia gladioli]MCA8167723.1 DEAD/DEAH box helicase [Burkholderia gladioli]
MEARECFLASVLDRIEEREARLLVWGIVDGVFGHEEICDLLNPLIDNAINDGLEDFFSAEDVLEELRQRKWIAEVPRSGGTTGYRSRMAETVRLLQRLRQLFSKHSGPTGWQRAPSLVADFRFLRRRRRYPARDISVEQALTMIGEAAPRPALLAAVQALLTSPDRTVRLSGFQVRAAQRILRAIETGEELATIVCAGTGSGKTLAFYLPALASIYRHVLVEDKSERWVKAVALYPRTELLKDQLREVLQRTRSLQAGLPQKGQESIRVGALYGDTPHSAQYCEWPQIGNDRVCPALTCLDCGGELRWLNKDRSEGRERLVCAHCEAVLDGAVFPLTRESLKNSVPDILFTTTEMLNQRLSDNSMMHLLGVGPKALRAPELVLMDEVHTYDGKHGAQVAYLMRRWQRLLEQPLRFVGLSATLREASQFFAALTGCRINLVDEVSPRADEIESEGAEYMIALRGDPISRAALLSTTIQTAMVLQRCLDPKAAPPEKSVSRGVFGQRTFVFTDNLDVINRLYFDLLSAEGRNSYGAPDIRHAPDGGLAVLREAGTSLLRYANGQDWRFCQDLHQGLKHRLVVKRVSSQDRGVDAGADVIVATAALEVGFDDPVVGAVIQHKAPRGMAGFLQRKGRGGRTRGMRPWTAVVLSDYGRDRAAYQSYDLLFDPELPVRTLPLTNRYITRMQAVYATIDYLALRLQDGPTGSVWIDLSGGDKINAQRRQRLLRELRNILESESGTRRLSDYLRRALRLSDEELSAILWEYPRPLLTTVLPTALRRLASHWSADGKPQQDYQAFNTPLPDFIPSSLFADLNLAEVAIDLPESHSASPFKAPVMSVFAALREFAPGRVSRRYGVRYRTERHWIAPLPDFQSGSGICSGVFGLDVDLLGSHVLIGEYLVCRGGKAVALPVYRPVRLTPQSPPTAVKDSSNSSLEWHSQIVATIEPSWLTPPAGSLWAEIVTRIGFFTHSSHAPVEIRRFAVGASAEIGVGAEKVRADTVFQRENQPVGLGAQFAADGMVFQIHIPPHLHLRKHSGDEAKWRAVRSARFVDLAWRGERLAMIDSPFMREWLAQIYLSALTYEAMHRQVGLAEADTSIRQGQASISLLDVLSLLFQSQVVEVQGDDDAIGSPDKLRQELEVYLRDQLVTAELHELGAILWEPIDADWESWLRGVYHSTFAAALLRSITDLCPNIDPEDLTVDLDRGPALPGQAAGFDPEAVEVWFTEHTPGGNGLIEEFMRRYAEDPRRFFATVRANLGMGEFELIDHQLKQFVTALSEGDVGGDSESAALVRQFRAADSQEEMAQSFRRLRRALTQEGFSSFHGFWVALGNRVLRPGSGAATDFYLSRALNQWQGEEARIGIEVDLRVISYYLSQSDDIDRVVSDIGSPPGSDRAAWRIGAIYGFLWPRGRAIRQSALQIRNPFAELPVIERLLVVDTIGDDRVCISLLDDDWLPQTAEQLTAGRQVTLTCPEIERAHLAAALNALVTNPVESGYLRVYARLQGIRQSQSMIEADIELVEAAQ